jgi:hypothetical protein
MANLKRYSYQVFFTALNSVPHVNPPFTAGHRDSMWVTTLSRDPATIRAEAMHKADACYGLRIGNIDIGSEIIL